MIDGVSKIVVVPTEVGTHLSTAANSTTTLTYRDIPIGRAAIMDPGFRRGDDKLSRRDAVEERTLILVRPEQLRRATIGGLGLDDGDYPASVG